MVLISLLYSCETWTVHSRHVHAKQPDHIHLICLRRLLHIRWQDKNPDTEVIERAGIPSGDTLLQRVQVTWAGHVARIPGCRLPKQVLYGELCQGKWSFGAEETFQRHASKTAHEVYRRHGYLRLSKDEQQQIQWPRTIAILRDVLIQVSVYLYRLNYTDVNSTALSINKTGGVKGTCKKANPYYIGLAGNDTLQKFRITFTANGRLQFTPCR